MKDLIEELNQAEASLDLAEANLKARETLVELRKAIIHTKLSTLALNPLIIGLSAAATALKILTIWEQE